MIANSQALAGALAEHGMRPVSGGTDGHLALLDLRDLGISGRDAEERCEVAVLVAEFPAYPR